MPDYGLLRKLWKRLLRFIAGFSRCGRYTARPKPRPATEATMNIDLTEGDITFQNEVRSFLTTEYPDDIRRKRNESVSLTRDDMIRWQKLLY